MGRFVRHEYCPKCGSRDNLARYDDGSAFCFGCRYSERRTSAGPSSPNAANRNDVSRSDFPILEGTSRDFPEEAVTYLSKYRISVPTALKSGLLFQHRNNQLIFTFHDKENHLTCVQARNFDPFRAAKGKYIGFGSTSEAFQIYQAQRASGGDELGRANVARHRLVITEDALSAIVVSRTCDAIACLGTNFQTHKISEVQKRGYQHVIVWLDSDKWREARHISENCQWLGLSSTTILTEADPKTYSDADISEYLK